MKVALLTSVLVLSAGLALAEGQEQRRAQCLGWMMQGYPSGIEETSCTAQFSLPSPFLFKCARARRVGFETEVQREACRIFFADVSAATGTAYVRSN